MAVGLGFREFGFKLREEGLGFVQFGIGRVVRFGSAIVIFGTVGLLLLFVDTRHGRFQLGGELGFEIGRPLAKAEVRFEEENGCGESQRGEEGVTAEEGVRVLGGWTALGVDWGDCEGWHVGALVLSS